MSGASYPVVMCDHEDCDEWALDHTLHGLVRLGSSATQLPEGWTGDRPGIGRDEQYCPRHPRTPDPTPPHEHHHDSAGVCTGCGHRLGSTT